MANILIDENTKVCPYCGSDKGYYRYESIGRYYFYYPNGKKDTSMTTDIRLRKDSWEHVRCVNCQRVIEEVKA